MSRIVYIIIGILVATILKVVHNVDGFRQVSLVSNYSCHYLDIDILGPEDIIPYKDNIILVGAGDYAKLWSKGTPILEQNSIYAIVNSHQPDYKVIKLEIQGFPTDIAFYPHGLYIKLGKTYDTLYAINHAYQFGGERVEVFQIGKDIKHLQYQHSFIMDAQYNGILNDLIVVSDNRLLITKYLAVPDAIRGRAYNSVVDKLTVMASQLTARRWTYVLDCRFELNQTIIIPTCRQLDDTNAVVANGITWDKVDRVWVADSIAKEVREYKLQDDGVIYVRTLNIGYALDNLEYQPSSNSLILGMIPKLYNYFSLEDFNKMHTLDRNTSIDNWAAVGEYDLVENTLTILEQGNSIIKALSGAVRSGDKLYLGSWCDISVMVCTLKQ